MQYRCYWCEILTFHMYLVGKTISKIAYWWPVLVYIDNF